MKTFSFYHRDTGVIHPASFSSTNPDDAALNTPAEHLAVEGHFDSLSQRVDTNTGAVVDYQPPAPSKDHAWNTDAKRWQLTDAAQAKADASTAALAQIAALEARGIRAMRELAIGTPGALARLQLIDNLIAALRPTIAQGVSLT